jgi:uncharacterized membrane protein
MSASSSIVYLASARICHQRPERSFAIADTRMPVCARCSALYLAGAAGALLAWAPPRRPKREVRSGSVPVVSRRVLLLAALPTAITFGLEFAGVMPFSNMARAVAAVPLGAAAGWLFVGMLRYDFRLNAHENAYR